MAWRKILISCFLMLFLPLYAAETSNPVQLSVWANEAIISTYTYSYKNFIERQKEIAHYFSASGWTSFSKAYNDAKLKESVETNAYTVSAVATMPPEIKLLHENYWQSVMPILVIYKNLQGAQKQHLEITIEFTLAPEDQGVRGLMITSLRAKKTSPACPCKSQP